MNELTLSTALETAINRIEDMLSDDDGQAFKEARKFLPVGRDALAAQPGSVGDVAELLSWFEEAGGFAQGTKAPHKWVLQAEQELRRFAAAPTEAKPAKDDALNTLCKMLHSGEEVEGDDGLAMLVPMDLWNEAQEAIELLVGEDDATEAVRMSEAEINHLVDTHVGGPTPSYPLGPEDWIKFARAVEQATAARLGVTLGDV